MAGRGITLILSQVTPPSVDIQTGAPVAGPQGSEKETMAMGSGLLGSTAMLGSVSARLVGSVASVATSMIVWDFTAAAKLTRIKTRDKTGVKNILPMVKLVVGEHLGFISPPKKRLRRSSARPGRLCQRNGYSGSRLIRQK